MTSLSTSTTLITFFFEIVRCMLQQSPTKAWQAECNGRQQQRMIERVLTFSVTRLLQVLLHAKCADSICWEVGSAICRFLPSFSMLTNVEDASFQSHVYLTVP